MAENIDDQITSLRENTSLPPEELGKRLEGLYLQKLVNPSESQSAEPSDAPDTLESIKEKVLDIRYNEKINPEKKGELLDELYKQRLTLERAAQAQPADPEAVKREVETELGTFGNQKITALCGVIADAFGDGADEKFKAFGKTLDLSASDQIDALHQIAELAKPVESKMSIEDCNIAVDDSLRGTWRERTDENFAFMQKAGRAIFGSLEKCEDFVIARGWGENPAAQVRFMVLLSRLGAKMKGV